LLCGRFPWAADRIRVVPKGVDVATIQAARSFADPGVVVLSVGRLERYKRVDRAVAAMASLDPAFRLVVVGDGPVRQRLEAHAADLRISSRVQFVGSVPDAQLYRWLRTGRVLVTLAEQAASGLPVIEAISAGAAVVASDIPVHREAVSRVDGAAVCFVSPEGSPLQVADAISEAARMSVPSSAPATVPSWDAVVDNTWAIYTGLIFESRRAGMAARDGMAELGVPGHRDGSDVAVRG
jgi:glycosyltransferase involved in cell wall biosynthesis